MRTQSKKIKLPKAREKAKTSYDQVVTGFSIVSD